LAEIHCCIIDRLPGGLDPEIEGIAAASALEAVEGVLLQVGGKAAGGAGRRAVQGAGAALLTAMAALGLEAEQVQDGNQSDRSANSSEVDGWTGTGIGVRRRLLVLGLALLFATLAGLG
jgi:hypothetical protein